MTAILEVSNIDNDVTTLSPLKITRRHDFPRLAWLCELSADLSIQCGSQVEVFDDGLVEGCWDGPFRAFGFLGCPNFFGSGLVDRV
jgi:hypothetical protein